MSWIKSDEGLALDKIWSWDKKKITCPIQSQTGNPAADDLRERLVELVGGNLVELLAEMKKRKVGQAKTVNGEPQVPNPDYETDKKYREILNRKHVLGATEQALEKVDEYGNPTIMRSLTRRNHKKMFAAMPKLPPKRILLEIQRERSRPLILPNYEERIAAAARLERKLAKQRAARKAGNELGGAGKGDTKVITDDLEGNGGRMTIHEIFHRFLPEDLFPERPVLSEHDLMKERGLMYLARVGADKEKKEDDDDDEKVEEEEEKKEEEKPPKDQDTTEQVEGEGDLERRPSSTEEILQIGFGNDAPNSSDAEAKLYCATALCNWARNLANAPRLAGEGAVRAIMRLSLEPIPNIGFFCAGAFRFMSDSLILANQMIDDGAISTINDIVKRGGLEDKDVGNLTIALVNLTRVGGKEGQVVEATIHQAFTNILATHPDLGPACARGLYNLTCVDSTYPLIEKVSRALIQLSSTTSVQNVKHICAAALCNLADLKAARMRLVEEGVIGVLGALSKGSETRTRRVCAVILQNLSASRACRVEMVARGAVQSAHSLSSDTDPIILRCIGLTLSRLALEPTNASRIIHELGIAALCNIAVKFPTIPGISQPVAMAFQFLSSNSSSNIRVSVVQEGSVAAIAALLRNSTDVFTFQHCLLAICNLLYEPDNHLSIVQQGLIVTLINLSTHENEILKDFCALAFLNLSCSEESRKHAVNGGAVVAIIRLASQPSKVTKARCAASLCNLSAAQGNGMERMVNDGVIPALVGLITAEDIDTVRYACAALCRLCATKDNGNLILQSGAVPTLVQRAIQGDAQTQQYCGAVLSSLSFYDSCRVQLFEMDIISALKKLADVNDDVTKQRCLAAFSNLSCEDSIQLKMVDQGVVAIISRLADSYQEINYTCCARALCNLACADEARLRVASEGGFEALMMISMVRSVDIQTKLLCIIALCNLLDDNTVDYMLKEGLVGSVANLSKMSDNDTTHLCATLMNQLTYYLEARKNIAEKVPILQSLFAMTSSDRTETRIMAARTTSNLVLCPEVGHQTLEAGALKSLEAGVDSGDDEAALQCLKAIFMASTEVRFLPMISRTSLPLTVCRYAKTCHDERHVLGVMSMTLLLWHMDSRPQLQNKALAEALIRLTADNPQTNTVQNLSLCLRYLCLGYKSHQELLQVNVLSALLSLYDADDMSSTIISESLAVIIRTLAESPECTTALATPRTIKMLKQVTDMCAKDNKTMYHVAVALCHFAACSTGTRQATASADVVTILSAISKFKDCAELVTVTLCFYLLDPKSRHAFTNQEVAAIVIHVITSNHPDDVTCNAISCLFALSKRAHCREFLTDAPLHTDMHLLKLSQSEDPKIKANCARTLKNMTSDSSEALEEGAVANLIAMSLDGKEKAIISEDLKVPSVIPAVLTDKNQPECAKYVLSDTMWFEAKMLVTGGPAGKGPEPPGPPPVDQDDSSQYASMIDEVETETDSKTKMAFAKMQAPQILRESCLLSDADFETIRDDNSDNEMPEPANGADDSLAMSFDDLNNGLEYGLGSGRGGAPSSYTGPGSLEEGSAFSDGPHSRGQKLRSIGSRPQSTAGTPNRGNTPRASTSNPSSRGGNSRSRHSSVVGDPSLSNSNSNSNTLKKGSHSDPFAPLQPLTDGDLNKQPRAKTASSAVRSAGTPKGNTPRAVSRAGGKAADMDLYN